MVEFIPIENRDAYQVIRGYVYQVDLTIERWLGLSAGQVLELECGEDIDTVSDALSSNERDRLLEQVKHRERSLTLRSSDALKALACAAKTRESNPDLSIVCRYMTNADVGLERPPIFDCKTPAIDIWEQIRTGQLGATDEQAAIERLAEYLSSASKPKDFRADTWEALVGIANSKTTEPLSKFLKAFEWSTGSPEPSEMQPRIEGLLIESNRADMQEEAEAQYLRLFSHVFKVLSQKGAKRLTTEELESHLALPTLGAEDRERLLYVQSILESLEARLSTIERVASANWRCIEHLQATVKTLVDDSNIDTVVAYALVEPTIDIPPQVQHLSKRAKAVSKVIGEFGPHTWIALTGTVGSGKTQLAILLAHEVNVCRAWISLRDKKKPFTHNYLDRCMEAIADHSISVSGRGRYEIAIQALNSGDLIVLDDTPPLEADRDLSDRFMFLLEACASQGVKVVSTSTFRLGGNFSSSAGKRLKELLVPPFAESEVSDVLRAYGATPEDADKWSSTVCALCYGHPALVAALARYLRNMNWKVSSLEHFESLFVRDAYATEINNDTTRRLVDTVQDADSRELLYRLNLATYGFDLEDVKVVASVKPPVSKAIERLRLLDGLWVQRTYDDRYAVSPLIRRLGHNDVPSERKKAIWYLLGTRILSKRILDVWDATHVVAYFTGAQVYQNALVVLSQALYVLTQQETLHDDALLGLFWSSSPFPPDVDLDLRIFVRSLQINVNTKLGRDVTCPVLDLGNLVQSAQTPNGWSVAFAGMELASQSELYAHHWELVHNVIAKAISIFPKVVLPNGSKLTSITAMGPESLIWLVTPNMSTVDQLGDWVHLLETLPSEALQKAFSIPEADQCCIELSLRVWSEEAKKDEEIRQWPKVLDCFDKLGTKARELGLTFLWACANRAKMIIHAEYLDELDAARKIAEGTMADGAEDRRIQVLMKEYLGQQYYWQGQRETARGWLEGAIEQEIELNPFGRLRSLVYLSVIVGEDDPQRALGLVLKAVELAKTSVGIPEVDLAKALSELAIAQWLLVKNVSAAFDSFDEAAERLFASKKDDIFWKALFVRFAHVAVYFANLARTGEAPTLADGQEYAEPFRGMFFTLADEKLAERFEEKRVWVCMAELASFASATKNDERAAYWAEKSLDMARSRGQSHAIVLSINDLVPHLLRNNEYAQVLDIALECSSAGVASTKLAKENRFSVEMSVDIPSVLGPKPSGLWSQAEQESAFAGLLPTAFRILTVALDDLPLAKEHSEEVAAICRQVSSTASSPDFWLLSSEIFSASFSETIGGKELVKKADESKKQGHDSLAVVGYMFTAMKSDYDIRHCVRAQLAAMPYVHHVLSKHMPSIYRLTVLSFLSQYWIMRVQQGRFLFSGPNIVEQSLREADSVPEAYRAQYILREVIRGLSIRMREEEVPSWLNERPPNAEQ